MKIPFSIACCIIILCSLMLIGVANAGNAAYSITEYITGTSSTIDGKWTSPSEWTDSPHTFMTGNATGKFAYKMGSTDTYTIQWIIEMLGDSTNNTGDYVQICIDDSNAGGSAPGASYTMLEVDGHTTLKCFTGTGTGWSQITPTPSEITWSTTIGTSMWSSTPHWILEIQDSDKTSGVITVPNPPPTGMRVAAFDAATSQLAAWAPNSTANNPNSWGLVADYQMNAIPEGFGLGAVVMLASVAMFVGFYYLQKRQKPSTLPPKNL